MNYINKLEVENKGLEVINKELKKEINDLKIYLAMAQGSRDLNEKMLFTTQKEKKEIKNKLAEAEKQIKILEKAVNNLTKENTKLKENTQQTLDLNTQTTNMDLQEVVLNGLNFLAKAMAYNQSNSQKI